MKYDVCCVGHMCVDILVKPVDSLPPRGKLKVIESIDQKTGGCAMNTALGLAKLGVNTAMVGKVGEDGFGSFIRGTLEAAGVHTDGLLTEQGGMTSGSVVTIDKEGERTILHCLGTNSSLRLEDIDLDIVYESGLLFIGGVFLLPSFDGAGAAGLLKQARSRGIVTAMDTAWDASGGWLDTIRPCLPHLDWFMPSVEEAEQMFGSRDPQKLAKMMKEQGVKNVVIKMGGDGCYIEPKDSRGTFQGIFPVEVVDTAGAGDAWCAGFLSALVRGRSAEEAAVWGNAAGSLCVTKVGTTAGIRDFADTQKFIDSRKA